MPAKQFHNEQTMQNKDLTDIQSRKCWNRR